MAPYLKLNIATFLNPVHQTPGPPVDVGAFASAMNTVRQQSLKNTADPVVAQRKAHVRLCWRLLPTIGSKHPAHKAASLRPAVAVHTTLRGIARFAVWGLPAMLATSCSFFMWLQTGISMPTRTARTRIIDLRQRAHHRATWPVGRPTDRRRPRPGAGSA